MSATEEQTSTWMELFKPIRFNYYIRQFTSITSIMNKKLVGHVTEDEKNEILLLFERRNGLNELAQILTPDKHELYEKLVKDMGETGTKFQKWWDTMAQKYNWESAENGNWEINFDTCEIFLVTP